MSYSVVTIAPFERQLKRLVKKYPSLKKEIAELGKALTENPVSGTPLGHTCYKIRVSVASKGRGKSGGARVITHVHIAQHIVYLIAIYDKSELGNITDSQIAKLLHHIKN
jgi:mRNA-degrading endonuclease RelE of RelBE toxin-antitoxin system